MQEILLTILQVLLDLLELSATKTSLIEICSNAAPELMEKLAKPCQTTVEPEIDNDGPDATIIYRLA